MIEIGASLAAARRARGLELREAERLTCMRGRYLSALEEERFDDLPGRTYARAFLRTYAAALDLDADKLVGAFDEQQPAPPEPVQPAKRPRPRRRFGVTPLATVACVALIGFLGWSEWTGSHSNTGGAIAGGRKPVAPAQPVAASHPVTRHVHVLAAHRTTRHAAPAALVLRATTGACWVLARRGGPAGPVLAEKTLQPGETLRLTAPHVWLRLGAPWNVTVHRGTRLVRVHSAAGLPVDAAA